MICGEVLGNGFTCVELLVRVSTPYGVEGMWTAGVQLGVALEVRRSRQRLHAHLTALRRRRQTSLHAWVTREG